MTLQSAIDAALPTLRAEALGRMQSRATVRRDTGDSAQDEETGADVPVWEDIYTDAPFRLGGSRGASATRTEETAGGTLELATRTGHFPHDHNLLADGDLIEITSGENEGLVLRIVDATWRDQATARRVQVVEATQPEEWA